MVAGLLRSNLLAGAGFSHGFTTRLAGDFAVLRDQVRLRENQSRLAQAVGFDVDRLHQAMQVHGSALLVAAADPKATLALEADALVAEPKSGDAVAVRVADCVPVLIADRHTGRVAAVHAGWRGVVARVVGATVRHLEQARAQEHRGGFVAAIGPCIGACCFEVGGDVGQQIAAASVAEVVVRRSGEKAYVDLRRAVRAQLRALGLADEEIEDVGGCTRCDGEQFHSYRRDGDASGRLIAVIVAR